MLVSQLAPAYGHRRRGYDYGRFDWATDPEGNRFELWEPRSPGHG